MSRSKPGDTTYGQIRLKCPHQHELGAIMVDPRRPIHGRKQIFRRLDDAMKAPKILQRLDDEELEPPPKTVKWVSLEPGLPLRAICGKCRNEHKPKYCYEEYSELIEPEIKKLADTPVVTFIFRQ